MRRTWRAARWIRWPWAQYIVSIAGWAAAPEDVSEFASRLSSMQPFTDVGVTEQRGVPGSRAQQFALRFKVGTGAHDAEGTKQVAKATLAADSQVAQAARHAGVGAEALSDYCQSQSTTGKAYNGLVLGACLNDLD